jgi:hypothetical protein
MATNRALKIMPLAAALAALAGTSVIVSEPAAAKTTDSTGANPQDAQKAGGRLPNRFASVGKDLLGFIVTTAADDTEIADDYSHVSHSSHVSHYSSSN